MSVDTAITFVLPFCTISIVVNSFTVELTDHERERVDRPERRSAIITRELRKYSI